MKTFMKPQYIKQIKLSFSGWSRLADVGVKRILNSSFFSWGSFAEALWKTVWKCCSKLLVFPLVTRSTKQPEHSTPPPISHLPLGWLACPIPMVKNEGTSVIVKFRMISVYSALYIMSQWNTGCQKNKDIVLLQSHRRLGSELVWFSCRNIHLACRNPKVCSDLPEKEAVMWGAWAFKWKGVSFFGMQLPQLPCDPSSLMG